MIFLNRSFFKKKFWLLSDLETRMMLFDLECLSVPYLDGRRAMTILLNLSVPNLVAECPSGQDDVFFSLSA